MGDDEAALLRLWREKRGEVEPEDLSGNLIVQLGLATEDLNRRWYEANTSQVITDTVRVVDMSGSNSWAEFAGLFRSTRQAFLEHERSKTELKALMPEDAKEAIGNGLRAKRSKSGAISFDLLEAENNRAAL